MLLPYASDRPPMRWPYMTWALLCLNAALFLWTWIAARRGGWWQAEAIYNTVGIVPAHFRPFTLLTYAFFHAGLAHLLINLFYLWVFGGGVEEAIGPGRLLLLYLASGAFGGLLEYWVTVAVLQQPGLMAQPIVGASAACAGLIGVFAVRYYRARLSFVGLPWRPHVVTVVTLFLALEIGTGLRDIWVGSGAGGAAHWTHVGGFVFGLVWAQAFRLGEAGERAYLRADALQAMEKNVPGAAIKRWESLLAREPNNLTARVELARAWLLLGDREQAGQHYLAALQGYLSHNRRAEAARLYAEMREHDLPAQGLSAAQRYFLAGALEEGEQPAFAAETYRALTVHEPDAPEAELALLKAASLYVHRLNRREEARILLRLFLERYPHSQWRSLAEDLQRAVT